MNPKTLLFFYIANEVAKKRGIVYEFKCPICGEKTQVIRSSINGYIYAECTICDIKVVQ